MPNPMSAVAGGVGGGGATGAVLTENGTASKISSMTALSGYLQTNDRFAIDRGGTNNYNVTPGGVVIYTAYVALKPSPTNPLNAAVSSNANGHGVFLTGGLGDGTGVGGGAYLYGGAGGVGTSASGGSVSVRAGSAQNNANGGNLFLYGGNGGATSGDGGYVNQNAGHGSTLGGNGGFAGAYGGDGFGTSFSGGGCYLSGGKAHSGANGGGTYLRSGAVVDGSGKAGDIVIQPGTNTLGFYGLVVAKGLPTSDPHIAGAVFTDTISKALFLSTG